MSPGFVANTLTSPPGFYGKILAHGDFVSRRLPRQFIDVWDRWLEGSMAVGAERLPGKWLDCYLRAPIWRFALGPGICGQTAWLGVLMPSVDKVGRHFPLTIAMPIPAGTALNDTLALSDRWFSHLEELALSTLEAEFNLDQFESELTSVPLRLSAVPRGFRGFGERGIKPPNGVAWLLSSEPMRLQFLFQSTYPIWSHFRLDKCSLWSSAGAEEIYPALAVSSGLPSIRQFPALINGDWVSFDWRVER